MASHELYAKMEGFGQSSARIIQSSQIKEIKQQQLEQERLLEN